MASPVRTLNENSHPPTHPGKPATSGNPTPGGENSHENSHRAERLGLAVMLLATLFVAVTAFRLAYAGSKGAALDAGLSAGDAAWYPLCVEGVLVVAAIATALLGGPYPWAVLLGFSALSIGANIVHAVDQPGPADWFTLGIAAVPPAALPLCVEMVSRSVRKLSHRETETVPPELAPPLTLVAGETPDLPEGETGPRSHPNSSRSDHRSHPAKVSRGETVSRVCDAGCGETVSRAAYYRHRQHGCPGSPR
jgi:hypothetical protein